jgi:hypothetical protein
VVDVWKEAIAVDGTRKVRPAGFASVDTKYDPPPKRHGRNFGFSYTPPPENASEKMNEPSPSRSGLPGIRMRQGQAAVINKSLTPLAFPFRLPLSKTVPLSFQNHTARSFHPERRGEGESLKT